MNQHAHRWILFAVAVTFLLLSTRVAPANAAETDPLAQIQRGVSAALAVFQNPRTPLAQRREELRQLAGTYFDFDVMAQSALGYHWRPLSAAQRDEFTKVFTLFIQDAYLSKLEGSTVRMIREESQSARIKYLGETFDGPDYAEVRSTVTVPEQKDPLSIDYLMHRGAGQWRIYDLTIDSISLIENYRNQFNRIINSDGFDQLIAELKHKTQQIEQYMAPGAETTKPVR